MEETKVEADIEISEYCLTQLRLSESPYLFRLAIEKWGVKFDLLYKILSFLDFISESYSDTDESVVFIFHKDGVRGLKEEGIFYLCIVHNDGRFMNESITVGYGL